MNATIPMLLVATAFTALASRSLAQESNHPKVSSRRPVDVSVEGLGEAARRAPGDTASGGSIGFSARRTGSGLTPLGCLQRIADQATGGCLVASSTPTLGALYPYPGSKNMFVPLAFVGGGKNNQATGLYSAIGGGFNNMATGNYATVAGGGGHYYGYGSLGNVASGSSAAVGGGRLNTASGDYASVAGGYVNVSSGSFATLGGGFGNTASGNNATVGGGQFNVASGFAATVGGGSTNSAVGVHSFAAGRQARANHDGAFVWGDSQRVNKASSAVDEFNVYASGGVRLFTNSAATTGVQLAPGGSTWTMVSDRDAKENIEPVDAQAVLDKVAQLSLATWNYKDQDDSIRHMGPMAQDFYAAFGLGLGNKTIDTIDPNGVALAAIQGLNAELEELRAEKEELKAQLSEVTRRLDELMANR